MLLLAITHHYKRGVHAITRVATPSHLLYLVNTSQHSHECTVMEEEAIALVLLEQALNEAQDELLALDFVVGRLGGILMGIAEDGIEPGRLYSWRFLKLCCFGLELEMVNCCNLFFRGC